MKNNCPGGRPRSSSVGDSLEIEEIEDFSRPLSQKHKQLSCQSLQFEEDQVPGSAKECTTAPVVSYPREKYQTFPEKQKRRGRPSFKSVKNLMSRLINPGASSGHTVSQGDFHHESETFTGARGGMARHEFSPDRYTDQDERTTGISHMDNVSRPLMVEISNWDQVPGTSGIQNHGNTCFMNAIIQCLSNTDCFAEYFVSKLYKREEYGFAKKLGLFASKGEVTEHLVSVLISLWTNRYNSDVSSSFKAAIGRNNEQYKGSSQHDSQEFLLWLLDKLNEELTCSIKKKQKLLASKPSDASLSDEQAASEVILQTNGSAVLNMFQALYRSSLQCPNCNRRSNTFESYLCLSLPLPYKVKRPVFVIIAEEIEPDKPIQQTKIGLQMFAHEMVKDLRVNVSHLTGVDEKKWVLCQIYAEGFRNTYSDDQPITDLPCVDTDPIYAIETRSFNRNGIESEDELEFEQSMVHIILVHTVKTSKYSRFCAPQVLQLPRDISGRGLHDKILQGLSPCLREGIIIQKSDFLFKLRLEDGSPGKDYLALNVEMPLYTEIVDSALSTYTDEYGPKHIKLVAEWDPSIQHKCIKYDNNKVDIDGTVMEVQQQQKQQQQCKVSLEECFQLFTKEEKLTGDAAWLCTHCKKQQQGATKTLALWSVPDILVIHLKRFRHVGQRRSKLNTLVDFPVKGLSMMQYILPKNNKFESPKQNKTPQQERLLEGQYKDDMTYDLYAVCNHYGDMQGGHYTAFCQNSLTDKWYKFDDTKVSQTTENDIKTPAAYLLFYQRRGLFHIAKDNLRNKTHWIYSVLPPVIRSQGQSRRLRDRSSSATRSSSCSSSQTSSKFSMKNADTGLSVKLPLEKNQRLQGSYDPKEYSKEYRDPSSNGSAARKAQDTGRHEFELRVDIESASNYRSETQENVNLRHDQRMSTQNNNKLEESPVNIMQLTSSPKPKLDFPTTNNLYDRKTSSKVGTRISPPVDPSLQNRAPTTMMHKSVHFEDEERNLSTEMNRGLVIDQNAHSAYESSTQKNNLMNKHIQSKNPYNAQNYNFTHASSCSQTSSSPSSQSPKTPSSAGSQSSYNEKYDATSTKVQEQDHTTRIKPPTIPQRKESLNISKNHAAARNEIPSEGMKMPKAGSIRPNSVPTSHNQSRGQVSSVPTASRQAWSTPQPVRKQATAHTHYKDDMDNNKPPRPPPPKFQEALPPRQPPRSVNKASSGKDYNPKDYSDNNPEKQSKHGSPVTPFVNNKSATLGRAPVQRNYPDIVLDTKLRLTKSNTDSSLSTKKSYHVNIDEGAMVSNEARSRKPVFNVDKQNDEHSDIFQRFIPHKHYYTHLPKKEMIQDFKKEKMYSPCPKESSV